MKFKWKRPLFLKKAKEKTVSFKCRRGGNTVERGVEFYWSFMGAIHVGTGWKSSGKRGVYCIHVGKRGDSGPYRGAYRLMEKGSEAKVEKLDYTRIDPLSQFFALENGRRHFSAGSDFAFGVELREKTEKNDFFRKGKRENLESR